MQTRKPWVTTLILVGVLAALAAYIFLFEAKREPPPEQDAPPTPAPLWEFKGSAIAAITVTRGEQTTAVEGSERVWRMIAPEEGEADSGRLNGLVYQIAMIQSTRAMAGIDDLANFGLDEPEVRATLVLTDGTAINLAIGAENPRHTARYVHKAGDPLVYLVNVSDVDGLLRLLDEPPYPPTPTPPPNLLETPPATLIPPPSPTPSS